MNINHSMVDIHPLYPLDFIRGTVVKMRLLKQDLIFGLIYKIKKV